MTNGSSEFREDLYSEDDARAFLSDRRMLAATHAFASQACTLGRAIDFALAVRPTVALDISSLGYARLMYEIARRIDSGQVIPPTSLEVDFAEIYESQELPKLHANIPNTPRDLTFVQLQDPHLRKKMLQEWRPAYNNEDFTALTNDKFFLALVQDHIEMRIDGFDIAKRMTGEDYAYPRDLSLQAFSNLLRAGEIALPPTLEQGPSNLHRIV